MIWAKQFCYRRRHSQQWDLTHLWFLSSQECHFLLQWQYQPQILSVCPLPCVQQYCTLRELFSLVNKPIVTTSFITRDFLTRKGWWVPGPSWQHGPSVHLAYRAARDDFKYCGSHWQKPIRCSRHRKMNKWMTSISTRNGIYLKQQ